MTPLFPLVQRILSPQTTVRTVAETAHSDDCHRLPLLAPTYSGTGMRERGIC